MPKASNAPARPIPRPLSNIHLPRLDQQKSSTPSEQQGTHGGVSRVGLNFTLDDVDLPPPRQRAAIDPQISFTLEDLAVPPRTEKSPRADPPVLGEQSAVGKIGEAPEKDDMETDDVPAAGITGRSKTPVLPLEESHRKREPVVGSTLAEPRASPLRSDRIAQMAHSAASLDAKYKQAQLLQERLRVMLALVGETVSQLNELVENMKGDVNFT